MKQQAGFSPSPSETTHVVATRDHRMATTWLALGWRPDKDGGLHLMANSGGWAKWLSTPKNKALMATMKCDPDAKASLEYEKTPLSYSVAKGDIQSARALLSLGANPKGVPSQRQGGPLHYCPNNAELLSMLVGAGADINTKNHFGVPPLSVWTNKKHSGAFIKRAVELGANPSIRDGDGATPLAEAFRMGHDGIAKTLIDSGASFSDLVQKGQSESSWPGEPAAMLFSILQMDGDPSVRIRRLAELLLGAGVLQTAMSSKINHGGRQSNPFQIAMLMGKWASAEVLLSYDPPLEARFPYTYANGKSISTLQGAMYLLGKEFDSSGPKSAETFAYRLFSKGLKSDPQKFSASFSEAVRDGVAAGRALNWLVEVRDRIALSGTQKVAAAPHSLSL